MKLTPEDIRRRFRERGLKVTEQRAAIYQALAQTSSHPTAKDLYRQVKRDHPMISYNTVYYTLAALQTAGLVQEVNYWHDRSRFDANVQSHHHLLCLGCRGITDVMDRDLDQVTVPEAARRGFEVTGHQVEFYGYCAGCRRNARRTRPRVARAR